MICGSIGDNSTEVGTISQTGALWENHSNFFFGLNLQLLVEYTRLRFCRGGELDGDEIEPRGGALMVRSKSMARRRLRPAQAKVHSTTQRRGRISQSPPYSECLMISIVHLPIVVSAVRSLSAAQPPSAEMWRSQTAGQLPSVSQKFRTSSQRRPAILADFLHSDALL